MKAIEIISRPEGDLPEWIMDAWVGCVIPLKKGYEKPVIGPVLTHQDEGDSILLGRGYVITVRAAIKALEERNPEAAQWWRDNKELSNGPNFMLEPQYCKLIKASE